MVLGKFEALLTTELSGDKLSLVHGVRHVIPGFVNNDSKRNKMKNALRIVLQRWLMRRRWRSIR